MLKSAAFLSISILLTFFGACTGEDQSEIGEGSINQEYLQSDSYQSFKERTLLEREQSITRRKNFINFVAKRLNANGGPNLTLPQTINSARIRSSYQSEPANRSSLTMLFGFEQVYHPLGYITAHNLDYYFFMTCKVKSYKDCLIWAASMRQKELYQVEMLTTYMEMLTYSEMPQIEITDSGINIEVNRNVEYPISTSESYSLKYHFNKNGKIVRQGSN